MTNRTAFRTFPPGPRWFLFVLFGELVEHSLVEGTEATNLYDILPAARSGVRGLCYVFGEPVVADVVARQVDAMSHGHGSTILELYSGIVETVYSLGTVETVQE